MVNNFREDRVSEAAVHLEVNLNDVSETFSKVSARNHRVISGILPNISTTKSSRVASSAINVLSCSSRLKVSPVKSRKSKVMKVLLLY